MALFDSILLCAQYVMVPDELFCDFPVLSDVHELIAKVPGREHYYSRFVVPETPESASTEPEEGKSTASGSDLEVPRNVAAIGQAVPNGTMLGLRVCGP